MRGRRAFLAALAAAPWAAGVAAEPRRKRLAILIPGPREKAHPHYSRTFVPLLAERGWIEGRTVDLLFFYFEGPPGNWETSARQVVEASPDAIQAGSTDSTRALQRATSTIPIVTWVGDPVGSGFARTLARPGGNITGLSHGLMELLTKLAEIARLALPRLQAVSLMVGLASQRPVMLEGAVQAGFRARGIEVTTRNLGSVDEWRAALRALPADGRGAAILIPGPGQSGDELLRAAIDLRVPTIGVGSGLVDAGGLISYEFYRVDGERRIVALLDKVLRGADPATIPFELPDRTRLSVNLKTARAIGITFAPDLLIRADRVIE